MMLFTWCKSKPSSQTGLTWQQSWPGWGQHKFHPFPLRSTGCSGLQSPDALSCHVLDISASSCSQLTLHIISFTALITTCACLWITSIMLALFWHRDKSHSRELCPQWGAQGKPFKWHLTLQSQVICVSHVTCYPPHFISRTPKIWNYETKTVKMLFGSSEFFSLKIWSLEKWENNHNGKIIWVWNQQNWIFATICTE